MHKQYELVRSYKDFVRCAIELPSSNVGQAGGINHNRNMSTFRLWNLMLSQSTRVLVSLLSLYSCCFGDDIHCYGLSKSLMPTMEST